MLENSTRSQLRDEESRLKVDSGKHCVPRTAGVLNFLASSANALLWNTKETRKNLDELGWLHKAGSLWKSRKKTPSGHALITCYDNTLMPVTSKG